MKVKQWAFVCVALAILISVQGLRKKEAEERTSGFELVYSNMAKDIAARSSWPELMGKDKDEAKSYLEKNTDKKVFLVPIDGVMTMDWSDARVRIKYDPKTNKVANIPEIG